MRWWIYCLAALSMLAVTCGCRGMIYLEDAGQDAEVQTDGQDGQDGYDAGVDSGGDSAGDGGQDAVIGDAATGDASTGDGGQDGGDDCIPNCDGKQCGADGCGGSCGECGGNSYSPDWLAYPPPGPCPDAAIRGKWSLAAPGFDQDSTWVTVTDLTTSDVQEPDFYFPSGSYGSFSYLAFAMSGVTAGHDYEVTIDGVKLGGYNDPPETLSYTVQVIDCSQY